MRLIWPIKKLKEHYFVLNLPHKVLYIYLNSVNAYKPANRNSLSQNFFGPFKYVIVDLSVSACGLYAHKGSIFGCSLRTKLEITVTMTPIILVFVLWQQKMKQQQLEQERLEQ